jgi:hypothetical protein
VSDDRRGADLGDLIEALSIPEESKVPDPREGRSTPEEYDAYFRLVRGQTGLLQWSRSCVRVLSEQLDDLAAAALTAEQKCRILEGMLLVQRVTLERWVELGERTDGGGDG